MSIILNSDSTNAPSKRCPQCDTVKAIELFRADRSKASGYGSICKACVALKRREHYHAHKEESKKNHDEWVKKNREYLRDYARFRRGQVSSFVAKAETRVTLSHEEAVVKRKQSDKEYRHKTDAHQKAYRKQYNASHRSESSQRVAKREASDLQFKLANRLRARTRLALRAQSAEKSLRSCDLLGCSFAFFREWIEKQFVEGMSWNNWGQGEGKWHLDHIKPVCSFQLIDPEQQKACFHYTNVRPLWAKDNLSKGPKLCHASM